MVSLIVLIEWYQRTIVFVAWQGIVLYIVVLRIHLHNHLEFLQEVEELRSEV